MQCDGTVNLMSRFVQQLRIHLCFFCFALEVLALEKKTKNNHVPTWMLCQSLDISFYCAI